VSTEPGRGVPGAGAPITDFPLAIGDSLVAALVSYYAAQYKLHVGRETGSISLTADGYHSRMDTLTIGAVVVGLMGHAIGVPLDRMAAVVATYLLPGIYVVQPDERGVVKRLGRVVAAATKTRAQYVLDSFGAGAEIVAAHLQEITPPREVADAFRDDASARGQKPHHPRGQRLREPHCAHGPRRRAAACHGGRGISDGEGVDRRGGVGPLPLHGGGYWKRPAV